MKKLLLCLSLISPFVSVGQSAFGIEAYRLGVDMIDKRLRFQSEEGYSAGVWYEKIFGSENAFGIKTSLTYTQVLTGNIQSSFLDVTQLPKWQRWLSFGIGAQVTVWKW